MKVRELIELLKTFDQELPVAFDIFSEHCLLEKEEIRILDLCEARPDGWVHDARPDKPSIPYLVFP